MIIVLNKKDGYNDLLKSIFDIKKEDSIKGKKYSFGLKDFDEKGNKKSESKTHPKK
jgi:hypothetical protein